MDNSNGRLKTNNAHEYFNEETRNSWAKGRKENGGRLSAWGIIWDKGAPNYDKLNSIFEARNHQLKMENMSKIRNLINYLLIFIKQG